MTMADSQADADPDADAEGEGGEGIAGEDLRRCVSLLRACAKKKDLLRGYGLHTDIIQGRIRGSHLIEKSPYLATALITLYFRCGSLTDACDVAEELPLRTVAVWNALVAGLAERKHMLDDALGCFELMRREGLSPDAITFISILKVCGRSRSLRKGTQVHAALRCRRLLETDLILGNALVDMYAKCGSMARARRVMKELPSRDVFSWSAIIAGYAKHGQAYEAFRCFKEMQAEGILPNSVTFICTLKACSSIGSVDMGREVHAEIVNRGFLQKDIVLGTALVDMYAKNGVLERAQEVLDQLSVRDVVSWSALIYGYSEQGRVHAAIDCFEQMQYEGLSPDAITFICVLKACGNEMVLDKGKQIHREIASRGLLKKHIALGNALVDMYAKCGTLTYACQVFEELVVRDVVTWNALITGYAEQGQFDKAVDCFEGLAMEGISPNTVTFICILKACANTGAIDMGEEIHGTVAREGLLEKDAVLANALLDMYAKCGVLMKARQVLEELPVRDVVCWNAFIAGCSEQGEAEEALKSYELMQVEGVSPNAITFACILKACGSIRAIGKGKEIHKEIERSGVLGGDDALVGNALVDMYSRCGSLAKAEEVLSGLAARDAVSWNALLTGYVNEGQAEEALGCFDKMQSEGLSPDVVTLICVAKACGIVGASDKGKRIHDEIVNRRSSLKNDTILGNALMDMYAKCGLHWRAQKILEELPMQDASSWNTRIASAARQGRGHEALHCYEQMRGRGLCADAVTFLALLKLFGSTGAIEKVERVHGEMLDRGLLEEHGVLGNALIDAYARVGMLGRAREVLRRLPARDAVSWSALAAGYARQGHVREAIECIEQMRGEGIAPDAAALLCLLSACARSGLLNGAEQIFGDMAPKYGVLPNLAHHTCMVVIFGGAGYFEKAVSVIGATPSAEDPALWLALLGACRKWGNVKLGRSAFDQAIQSDCNCAPAYVHMANLFASAGMQDDSVCVEDVGRRRALQRVDR